MMEFVVVEARVSGVECRAMSRALHLCPFKHEVDEGALEVVWRTTARTVELHSLSAYIDTWAGVEISHEDFVAAVLADLARSGVEPVSVTWFGKTAGMDVEVRSSAVLRQSID